MIPTQYRVDVLVKKVVRALFPLVAQAPLSERLGTFGWWDWLIDRPWWLGMLLFVVITPIGLWVVRLVFQGFWVNPLKYDWMSFNCDVLLALSFGAMLTLGQRVDSSARLEPEKLRNWLGVLIVLGWVGFGVFHMWSERHQVRTWSRRLGATSLYHFPMYAVIGYPLTYVGVNVVVSAPWSLATVLLRLVAIAGPVAWLCVGLFYDPKHQLAPNGVSKHHYTSPEDGWRTVRPLWQWLAASTDMSQRIGTLQAFNFVINRKTAQSFLVMATVSPGMFFVLNTVMYDRWVPLSYQWFSALIGDIALSLYVSFCVQRLLTMRIDRPVSRARWVHWLVVALAYAISLGHYWQEADSMSWSQHLGVNALYHTLVVYPVFFYAIVALTVVVWRNSTRVGKFWVAVMLGMVIATWAGWGVYDGAHQLAPNGVSKHEYANPTDGWHNVRLAYDWVVAKLF